MYMATVVGAGPAGLIAARDIQKAGFNTTVIEEHPKVGIPVNCTGIISASGVIDTGVQKEVEETLMNKIRGAQIFSPNHETIEVKRSETVAYVINRGRFDQVLARNAEEAGVGVKLNTKLIDVRNETVFVEHKGRGEIIKSKVLIGADGVNSKTRNIIGMHTTINDYVHAYQVVAKGNFDPKYVQLYFGDYAKNFFAWVVPENEERARVGLASTSGTIRKDFNVFMSDKNMVDFCDKCSSLIPIGKPLKKIVQDNVLLVGDAAFQTKATTGGGIIIGMAAAQAAAKAVNGHFKDGLPLKDYEKHVAPINKELKLHWKLRQYLNSKSEEQMDKLFEKMNKAKIGEFLSQHGDMDKPSKFVGKIMAKPSMWRLFPEAIKFMRT